MNLTSAFENQTLVDLAVQLYGDASKVVELALDNDLEGLNWRPMSGQQFKHEPTLATPLATDFSLNNVTVNSGPVTVEQCTTGIGCMVIEGEPPFTVS